MAEPLSSRLSWALLWAGVLAALVLPAPTLHWLGIPYTLPEGSALAKIHPASGLIVAALLLALVARGHPLRAAGRALARQPLVAAYLACMVGTALWSLARHGAGGAAFFVDTLWLPGIALLVMGLHPRDRALALGRLIAVVLVLNAALALTEPPRGATWIPQTVGLPPDLLPDAYFRASALFGHPLANALASASLLPMLRLLPLPPALRLGAVALVLLALLAFGGRTALAASVLLYGLWGLGWVLQQAAARRFSPRQWLGALVGLLLAGMAMGGTVAATGLGERIFANLTWDNSANVRLVVWQALDHLDAVDWWVGVSPQRLDLIASLIGLDLRYEAIENFWICILMQVGLVGFIPFALGLALGTWHVWRGADGALRVGIVLFYLVGSGANTLASKTPALLLLFVAAQAMAALRPAAAARPGTHGAQGAGRTQGTQGTRGTQGAHGTRGASRSAGTAPTPAPAPANRTAARQPPRAPLFASRGPT